MEFSALVNPARIVVQKIMELKKGETFLVARDSMTSRRISDALLVAAEMVGADPIAVTYASPQTEAESFTRRLRKNPKLTLTTWNKQTVHYLYLNEEPRSTTREPPNAVVQMLKSVDAAFIYAESRYPPEAVHEAIRAGTRILTAGWLTEQSFVRMLRIDYDDMVKLGRKLSSALAGRHKIRVSTLKGTDLTFEHSDDRPFPFEDWTGPCREKGKSVSFALGMAGSSPLEGTGNGTVVVDGSVLQVGVPMIELLKLSVKDHKVTNIQGGGQIGKELVRELEEINDPNAFACPSEWGIGLNPGANMGPDIESECVYGTVHFAVGRNDHVAGGKIMSKFHCDFNLWNPKIEVDRNVILEDGVFNV